MSPNSNTTALILFARSAKTEAKEKSILSTKRQNQALQLELLKQAKRVAKQSNLPFFHFHEGNQSGEAFGSRLYQAISSVISKGYDRVIIMGSDSPDMSVGEIHHAAKLLQTNQLVIGPDRRGGTYLIGLHKSVLKDELIKLRWCTSHLVNDLFNYASKYSGSSASINSLIDINEIADLHFALRINFKLRKQLKTLFGPIDSREIFQTSTSSVLHHKCLRRGPPVIV